ncbi:MAG: metalloregulator ArsR/SmtB family transcription factor [Sedimentibacter sp.]
MKNDYNNYALSMKALSDETRVKIFEMLSHDELCACKILEEFNITQPTLSYHMKILCESGLVGSRKDGSMTKYSINKDTLKSLRNFIDIICENGKTESQYKIKGE